MTFIHLIMLNVNVLLSPFDILTKATSGHLAKSGDIFD